MVLRPFTVAEPLAVPRLTVAVLPPTPTTGPGLALIDRLPVRAQHASQDRHPGSLHLLPHPLRRDPFIQYHTVALPVRSGPARLPGQSHSLEVSQNAPILLGQTPALSHHLRHSPQLDPPHRGLQVREAEVVSQLLKTSRLPATAQSGRGSRDRQADVGARSDNAGPAPRHWW